MDYCIYGLGLTQLPRDKNVNYNFEAAKFENIVLVMA